MIKAIIFLTKLIVVTFVALFFSSCKYDINLGNHNKGSGNITTETRTVVGDFNKIDVSYGIEVEVEQSENKSITVEADDNLQKYISVKVENGVLVIDSKEGYNSTKTPLVTVKMPHISGLSTSSGSEIKSKNTLISDNIEVKSSSGSEINISVEADAISLETSSGSNIKARGKALKLETSSSSGSEIDAEKLMSNEVSSQSNSGSNTTVSPILSLKATASSGSEITYHGVPKTVVKNTSSGGSIDKE
jgi:Putative auto-transporter adhesin, head GIN domain